MIRKHLTFTSSILVGLALVPASSFAFRNGPPPEHTGSTASGGTTCTACHTLSGPAGTGSVEIMGAPTAYAINQVYDITIRISDPDQAGAGFQFDVEDPTGNHVGTLIVTDTDNTKYNDVDPNWINHTQTGVDNAVAAWAGLGNAAEYHLQWKAPATNIGPIDFWAAGNAINNNFSRTGDHIYTAHLQASLDPASVPTIGELGMMGMFSVFVIAAAMILRKRQRAAF